MKKYTYLPHAADEKFQAFGKSLEEAFKNAAYALVNIITRDKIKAKIKHKIKIISENKEALLYDFLEQFLILLDSKRFLLSKITKIKITEKNKKLTLTAEIMGDNYSENYAIRTHVKAITYEYMFIKQEKGKWTLQVLVDI